MNRTRLLMIGVLALALGFVASVYVYRNLQGKGGASDEPIKVIKIPRGDLPPGAPRRRADVLGHGVIVPISKGEFILPNRLAGENAGSGLPALIPPGMRAVSVRVNDIVSVAGFVTPGTRVDVLLTGTPGASGEQETTTVLQNVAVLASGHTLERTSTGEAQNTAVITLLVSPDDAQRLTLASSEGHIQLALRNPLDTKQDDVPSSNAKGLYKGAAVAAPVHAPVHHAAVKTIAPPPVTPTGVSVEIYQGDKKPDVVKFPDDNSEAK
jgi:pilus assembly protein CpaB